MSSANVTIQAGVCGFTTTAVATSDDDQMVSFAIESDCENIKRLAGLLGPVDAYGELGAGFDGAMHSAARQALKGCCSGCVVPSGLFKAMQVAARLALPKDISIRFEPEAAN